MWNEAHQKKKRAKKGRLKKAPFFFLKKKGTLTKKKRAAEGDKKKPPFFFKKKGHEKVKTFASKFWVEYICFGAKSVLGKYTFWLERHCWQPRQSQQSLKMDKL